MKVSLDYYWFLHLHINSFFLCLGTWQTTMGRMQGWRPLWTPQRWDIFLYHKLCVNISKRWISRNESIFFETQNIELLKFANVHKHSDQNSEQKRSWQITAEYEGDQFAGLARMRMYQVLIHTDAHVSSGKLEYDLGHGMCHLSTLLGGNHYHHCCYVPSGHLHRGTIMKPSLKHYGTTLEPWNHHWSIMEPSWNQPWW